MQLFNGLEHTDYQDTFRAIGLFVDQEKLRGVRLIEVEDGMLLQGMPAVGSIEQSMRTTLFKDDDLRELLKDAYTRRVPISPTIEVAAPPLLAPDGEVVFRPGWTSLTANLRNIGAGLAQHINVSARWRNLTLAGSLRAIEPGAVGAITVERTASPPDDTLPEIDDPVLRVRVLYRDRGPNLYDLHCDYGFQGGGWRVTRIPVPRVREQIGANAAD